MQRLNVHMPIHMPRLSTRTRYLPRHGVASIEFLMMMPVLVTFVAVTFWAARVLIAGIHAGQVAEESVREIAASSQTIGELEKLPALGAIQSKELEQLVRGFEPHLRIDSGLVGAESVQESGEGVTGVIHAVGPAADRHVTLTHAWESELFAFPSSSAHQKPLTLPSAIRGIAPSIQDLAKFRQLLSFKSFATDNASIISQVATRISNSSFAIDQELPILTEKIKTLSQQIARLRQISPADPALSGLQAELDELQGQEKSLIEAQRLIDQQLAQSILFKAPAASPEH